MRRYILYAASAAILLLPLSQCRTADTNSRITLSNTTGIKLTDAAVTIERSQIPDLPQEPGFPLLISEQVDTIPAQLNDLDGDNAWDELFFVVNLEAKEVKNLSLEWVRQQPSYTIRTNVRFGKRSSADTPVQAALEETLMATDLPRSIGFQPYQTDGPSWENDKIGFRHYLDGRNAKDLFGKTTSAISPDNVGINDRGAVVDNYHVMADWGRDILAVGNSLGLGGFGLMTADHLFRLGVTVDDAVNNIERTVFRILAEGPVNSVLNYSYEKWQPGANRNYNVTETTSIWPGMFGYRNTIKFSGLQGDENLIIGIVNSNNQNPLQVFGVNDQWQVLLTHDMQTYERQWWLGMALIVPADQYFGYSEAPKSGKLSNTFLAVLKVENNKPITYYAAAGWELSDERFKDVAYFKEYITNLAEQLSVVIEVSIK
jgi:hypothetical protein